MRNKVSLLTRNEIKRIAVSYATSPDEVSASYYVEEYNVTESVFYSCLEKAVMESIVDLETANMIAAKAGRNGARHAGEGARVNSSKHYQRFIDARKGFKFKATDRKKFVKMYANSEKGFKSFCNDECVATSILSEAIWTAVINEEVDDAVIEKLYEKSVKARGEEKAKPYYDELKARRTAHREARLAKERTKRQERTARKKAEKARVAAEEAEARLKAEQREFVQMTLSDYGIPAELGEQKASLGITEEEV